MQMTLILNICEKLALAFGIIGLVGFVEYLIIAIVLSVKNKSIEPLHSVFPQEQPWYLVLCQDLVQVKMRFSSS